MHSPDIITEAVVGESSLFNDTVVPANRVSILEDFKVIRGDDNVEELVAGEEPVDKRLEWQDRTAQLQHRESHQEEQSQGRRVPQTLRRVQWGQIVSHTNLRPIKTAHLIAEGLCQTPRREQGTHKEKGGRGTELEEAGGGKGFPN